MKLIDSTLDISPNLHMLNIPVTSRLVFFDIETTGFVALRTSLYIIGCIYRINNTWKFRQWFLENHNEEPAVLREFSEFLSNFDTIIHFNGTTFDIPYMNKKYARYMQSSPFDSLESIDIYKCISPYKKLLSLDSLKQKSCEQFLGIFREDMFSGGDLIELYKVYTETFDKNLLEILLLHNKEDLTGMLKILPMLAYPRLFDTIPEFVTFDIHDYNSASGESSKELFLEFRYAFSVPVAFKYQPEADILMSFEKDIIKIRVPVYTMELKYFYNNYKDYYYLPIEDYAIHKSVAQFVDKEFRQKAIAANCYSRKNSTFIPITSKAVKKASDYQVFRKEYASDEAFFELPTDNTPEALTAFYTTYLSLLTVNI